MGRARVVKDLKKRRHHVPNEAAVDFSGVFSLDAPEKRMKLKLEELSGVE